MQWQLTTICQKPMKRLTAIVGDPEDCILEASSDWRSVLCKRTVHGSGDYSIDSAEVSIVKERELVH